MWCDKNKVEDDQRNLPMSEVIFMQIFFHLKHVAGPTQFRPDRRHGYFFI